MDFFLIYVMWPKIFYEKDFFIWGAFLGGGLRVRGVGGGGQHPRQALGLPAQPPEPDLGPASMVHLGGHFLG